MKAPTEHDRAIMAQPDRTVRTMAEIYRRKVARLAEALKHPEDRDEAATAIRGLIERIVLTPGEKWSEVRVTLHSDLGRILEWNAEGDGKNRDGTSWPGLSVSAETEPRFSRDRHLIAVPI